jgi:hypothetical protein
MNSSIARTRTALSTARFVLLAVCTLALTACETDGTGPSAADAPKAEMAAKPPETPKAESSKPEAPKPQAAKPVEQAAEPEEPMTRSRAARECWMRTEKGSARADLDKRADLVNKCIDDKLRAAGVPAPKT